MTAAVAVIAALQKTVASTASVLLWLTCSRTLNQNSKRSYPRVTVIGYSLAMVAKLGLEATAPSP